MKLTILGSGTSIVKKERKGPSFLLELDRKLLLLDCGWGCAVNLSKTDYDIQNIDHILISHPHADHLGDLINILHSILNSGIYYPKTKRQKRLCLHGYQGFKNDYEKLRKIMFPERVEEYQIKIFEYLNSKRKFNNLTIKAKEVPHVPEYFHSVGYRVESQNRILSYSGDSGYDENQIELARDADLAIFEMAVHPAQYQKEGSKPNHLSAHEIGKIAQEAGAKKIVLIHLYDLASPKEILKEVGENFQGEVVIAHDLQVIKL